MTNNPRGTFFMKRKNDSAQKYNVREYTELSHLLQNPLRSPRQLNSLFTADVEILKLKRNFYFAITTDSISDEISWNLYRSPETWGWMTVIASISDMAASATIPSGVVINSLWNESTPFRIKKQTQKGINLALKATQTPLLGGDLGVSHDISLTSTVVGFNTHKPLTRVGVKTNDLVAIINKGKSGLGPAMGFGVLFNSKFKIAEKNYRPLPRPDLIAKMRKFCNASIDTSDGIATSLHILKELNHVGFQLQYNKELFHPKALQFCAINKISPLMLIMGDHGDYQTIITFNQKHLAKIENILNAHNENLVVLGKATRELNIQIEYENKNVILPTEKLQKISRDFKSYKKKMAELNRTLSRSV